MPFFLNTPDQLTHKIPIGISDCLLGENVEYNGEHSHSNHCDNVLSGYFEYQNIYPKMVAESGTPRPTRRLEGGPNSPKMTFIKNSNKGASGIFMAASKRYLKKLSYIDSYILMKKFPNCGIERIKAYQQNDHPHVKRSAGIFTKERQKHRRLLPIEKNGPLNNLTLKEHFYYAFLLTMIFAIALEKNQK